MMFIVGLIVGLIMAILIVLASLISHRTGVNLIDKAEDVAKHIVPPKRGVMFKPKGLEEQRQDRVLQRNNEKGVDTKLTDLL